MSIRKFLPLLAMAALALGLIHISCDELVTENNYITQYDSTTGEVCVTCHTDDDNRYLRPTGQWENSAHADDHLLQTIVDINGSDADVASCGPQCHTHEGYIKYIDQGVIQAVTAPNVIGCFTCHEPHTGDFGTWSDRTLRGDEEFILLQGPRVYGDQGASTICAQCHQALEAHPDTTLPTVTLTWNFGPHYSGQADVMIGVGGYLFTDTLIENSHDSIPDGCFGCHYGTGQGYNFGQHTFRLENDFTEQQYLANCEGSGCHSSGASLDNLYDYVKYDSLEIFADSLETLLKNWDYLDPEDDSGLAINVGARMENDLAQILYNYLLYRMDGSRGVHNPAYMRELLRQSVENWKGVPPIARIGVSTDGGCAPLTVTFYDSSLASQGIVQREWLIEDSTIYDEVTVTWDFNEPGNYMARLIVVDLNGTADTADVTGAVAFFGADTTRGFAPLAITFTDSSDCTDLASTWIWDFADGDSAFVQGPVTHIFDTTGSFLVTLEVDNGISSDTYTRTVLTTGPEANFTVDRTFGFADLDITFTDFSQPDSTIEMRIWHFGDGDSLRTTDTSVIHTYTSPGMYDVAYRCSSRYGEDSYLAQELIQVFQTVAIFSSDIRDGCAPLDIWFYNQTIGDVDSVMWAFGDGDTVFVSDPLALDSASHTYDSVGLFTVTLVAFSGDFQDESVRGGYVNVTGPSPVFEMLVIDTTVTPPDTAGYVDDNSIVCALQQVVSFLPDTSCAIDSSMWVFGGYADETVDTVYGLYTSRTFPDEGIYDVMHWAGNQYGADSTTTSVLVTKVDASISVLSSNQGCAPLTVDLQNPGSGCDIYEWIWDYGDGAVETITDTNITTHIYELSGTFEATLIVTGTGGIADTSEPATISVTGVEAEFFPVEDSVCAGVPAEFTTVTECSVDNWTLIWDFGDGDPSPDDSIVVNDTITVEHIFEDGGEFEVTLEARSENDTATFVDTITVVDAAPVANFTMLPPDTVVAGRSVAFTDASENGNYWKWDFAFDNNTIDMTHDGRIPSFQYYYEPGTYYIVYTVGNACSEDSKKDTLVVIPSTAPRNQSSTTGK